MVEYTLNITNSSMKFLKRIFVELLDKDKNLVTVMKTDEEGNIFFDGDVIKYFNILQKYENNKEYREAKEVPIVATYSHLPLTKLDENRYVVLPKYNGKRVINIVCTWYDKAGNKVGQAISNNESDCNMFISTSKAQPTYFTLTTKKGEKKEFRDIDSRKNFKPAITLKPQFGFNINMIPV